jgi:signal transduction histidine kinase
LRTSLEPRRLFALATRPGESPRAVPRTISRLRQTEAAADLAAFDAPLSAVAPPANAPLGEASAQAAKNTAEELQRRELYLQQNIRNFEAARRAEITSEEDSSAGALGRLSRSVASKTLAAASAPPPSAAAVAKPESEHTTPAADVSTDHLRDSVFEAEPVSATPSTIPLPALLRAAWLDGELLLLRETRRDAGTAVEGVWLDWPEIQAWLLGRVADLLPDAEIRPAGGDDLVTSASSENGTRRLAFLPLVLDPGPLAPADAETAAWSPLRISLAAAWISAAIGVLALGALTHGTLRLSERRGAFVSAVTHELRTPLTTFRMYTEMLSGGMVRDEARRREYLDTLRTESDRLAHLVDNVLGYSRIERGRAASRVEETTASELLARMQRRLRERLAQVGTSLEVEIDPAAADTPLRTDTTAVEQVLFNLVDNAAKYARPPADAPAAAVVRIRIGPAARGRIAFRVIDGGPGLPPDARRRLFHPFSKSAHDATRRRSRARPLPSPRPRRAARRPRARKHRSGRDDLPFRDTARHLTRERSSVPSSRRAVLSLPPVGPSGFLIRGAKRPAYCLGHT